MLQKALQIGNSVGIILPRALRDELGIKAGTPVYVEKDINGNSITISQKKPGIDSSITPDFIRAFFKVNQKYSKAFAKLAHLR